MPAEYYVNVIYPLQDKAIQAFRDSPFYLTGGTALSRGYYDHRYSDDLDYFVNHHPEFQRVAQVQIDRLARLFEGEVDIDVRGQYFIRLFVHSPLLKIELINDVPSHISSFVEHPILGRIDSKENILANKLTAIIDRTLPKDIVDMYFLLKDGLSLKKALLDADSKAAGIAPLLVAKVLDEFDCTLVDTEIKWVTPVPSETVRDYLTHLALVIAEGRL